MIRGFPDRTPFYADRDCELCVLVCEYGVAVKIVGKSIVQLSNPDAAMLESYLFSVTVEPNDTRTKLGLSFSRLNDQALPTSWQDTFQSRMNERLR